MLPGFWLSRQAEKQKKLIANGLPDALDLLIVCVEAGMGLDQAIAKAAEELAVSHPRAVGGAGTDHTEVRAGKPRMEAFKNFAERTKVDDVRQLVSVLVQTDRFGTSVAQALRTQAEVSRTKRRQRAEERAAEARRQARLPARVLPVSGNVRRHTRPGRHQVREVLCRDVTASRQTKREEREKTT